MKIAVIGSGGVGGYFGGRLAAAGEDVTFLARGAHLEALRREGLAIESPKGDLHLPSVAASDDPRAVGPVDVVLLAVKLYDVSAAVATLDPLIGPDTVVVTLQNGVAAVELVSRHVGPAHVAGGVAYIVASIDRPGRIRHVTADRLICGERDGSRSGRLVGLAEAGRRAGFEASVSGAIEVDLWTKFVRLSIWSGVTSVARSPMGVIRDDAALLAMTMAGLDEGIAVGRARGIAFPESLREETLALVRGFPFQSKSSMLEDLEHGRRLELPWLSGALVEMGRSVGVPTPVHEFVATVLGPFVEGRPAAQEAARDAGPPLLP